MQYSMRPQAEWNVTIPVKVQYLFYYTHAYRIVSGSLNLARTCMHSRMTLLVSEGLVSHYDIRLAACLWANVRLQKTGLHLHSPTAKLSRYLDGAQTMMPLLEYLCSYLRSISSMPTTKQHIARQTPPPLHPVIVLSSTLTMAKIVTTCTLRLL